MRRTSIRYAIAHARTFARANDMLEDMFCSGEVCEGERPLIETRRVGRKLWYVITVEESFDVDTSETVSYAYA